MLEGECGRTINSIGLELSVDFLHDFSDYQTKQSLVYDLQEPYRWLSDLSVIKAFESQALKLSDFYFTGDDYRYRFQPEARQGFIDLIRERFNSGVLYNGRKLKWDIVIEHKANELGRGLVNRSVPVDFEEPSPLLVRLDDRELRSRINALSQFEARELGIGRSTLHYLRSKSRSDASFEVTSKTRTRLSLCH